MKKLEDKIISKVYKYETKRTSFDLLLKILGLLGLTIFAFIFLTTIIEDLLDQRAFDLFQIFNEDVEVIKKYFLDTLYVFYQILPKSLSILLLTVFILTAIIIFTVVKNFDLIRNKVKSLVKFWFKKKA